MCTRLMILFLPVAALMDLPASVSSTVFSERDSTASRQQVNNTPEVTDSIHKYADDDQQGAQENFGVQPVHDNEIFAVLFGDRFEYQTGEGEGILLWDLSAWVGSDYNKVYLEGEGAWLGESEGFEEAGVELLYGRNIATFWDLRAGIRHDFKPDPDRTFAALGAQGLAPYWFEIEATAYVSEAGDISAGFEVEYHFLLSQRLILQPRFETEVALQAVEEYGTGQGINDIELGCRLRYEIRRELAPYVGISWSRKLGETADLAEAGGEHVGVASLVIGLKYWI